MVTRISTILFACALAILLTASVASAANGEDVRNSRHNLGSTGGWNTTTDTSRICVFCHTPHGSNTASPVPLWNKEMTVAAYTRRGDGTVGPDDFADAGGVSLACLQCHDGTQALDVFINAPGSGDDDETTFAFYEFDTFSEAQRTSTDGGGCGACEISYIGTDLTNDHPVMLAFAEGDCGADGTNAGTCAGTHTDGSSTAEFNAPTWNGSTFEFDNGIRLGMRASGDFFDGPQMATDRGAAATDFGTVECYSCHNPHIGSPQTGNNGRSSSVTGNSEMFLRVAGNANSEICLTCHVK